MKKIPPDRISRFRQSIHQKTVHLKSLCLKAGHADLLLAGTPTQVFRKCGKPNCRCAQGGSARHGPYKVVQVRQQGKQRQITLNADEGHFFQMAQHYQTQMKNRSQIIALHKLILDELDRMLEDRMIWNKK